MPTSPSPLALGETPAQRAARRALAATKKAPASSKRRKKKKPKKLPVCTARDLKKPKAKRRRCRIVKPVAKPPVRRPSPSGPVAAPPATAASPDAFPAPPTTVDGAFASTPGLGRYDGPWGVAQATRLLSRAGFGPLPGQDEEFARLGLRASVERLMSPGGSELIGPAPSGGFLIGGGFAPGDLWGHLHLAFLDRAVRGRDQLGERMTLIMHDWFAVSDSGSERKLMPAHLELLRSSWRGSFRALLKEVTRDPAMLLYLNGTSNRNGAPNENYARELMELYALGADRGAYTETDVRELARALTGFRNDWLPLVGAVNFRFDPARFDKGTKTLWAGTSWQRAGALGWEDAVSAVVDHPMHPSFVALKLWSSFVATAPRPETQAALEALYRSSGERLEPLIEAILSHPDLYRGPAMVKPPVVQAAAMLRGRGLGVTSDAWAWACADAGQMVGEPPNVSGWNDRAWLNTATYGARWYIVTVLVRWASATSTSYRGRTETSEEAVSAALAFWGNPVLSDEALAAVRRAASQTWAPRTPGDQYGTLENFLAQRQNALRLMIGVCPDFQVA